MEAVGYIMLPTIQEYKDSFREPSDYFKTLTLEPLPSKFDENDPYFIAGGFACVFKVQVKTEYQNQFWAFKCFLQDDPHRNQRLEILSDFLQNRTENYFLPTHYYTDELWVCSNLCEDGEYPTLAMKWVEGLTLGEYVHKAAKDKNTQKLTAIYEQFLRLAHFLLSNDFAHGDLKHDNILVDKDENLILIDYDGMYLPSLTDFPSPELGGYGYQHPKRTAQDWGRHIDDFSILVILLSLRAYILLPSLIEQHKNENLFLTSEDLQNPMQSKPLQTLWQQNDEPLKHLLGMLLNSLAQNNLRVLEIGAFVERNKVEEKEFAFDRQWWNGLSDEWKKIFVNQVKGKKNELDFFEGIKDLNALFLHLQNIKELPEWIGNLINLIKLSLSYSTLTSLPESIGNLKRLEELRLSLNKLNSLPKSIGNLINLTSLQLWGNQFTSLPNELGNLINLTNLQLWGNQFTSLPNELGNLSNLTALGLSNNLLTSIPNELGNLINLTKLGLSNNQLTSLPESIGKLTNLTMLNLSYNQLTFLPESIGNLTDLNELLLQDNQLTSLPESIGNLKWLNELSLNNNQITSFPKIIENLINLTVLKLSGNKLTSLPEGIGSLINLFQLNLSDNQLTSLPESIGNLTNLEKLDLRGNRLTKLPKSIGNMINLTECDLGMNRIEKISDSISNLHKLKTLRLGKNMLSNYEQKRITELLPNCDVQHR